MPHHGEALGAPFVEALPTYTVYLDAGVYYAVNNSTGVIDFNNVDPAVVVQACLTAGGAGCVVGMREGNFVALTGVAATANNQVIFGHGRGTYWDATALLTGVHAFIISGYTGCEFRNFAIETLAGGTLVNHCIFIEDGADDFRVINITIIDSDSDGIHVEGTTITGGRIQNCDIEGADGGGILVDMDAANFIYRLRVKDCTVLACGADGILFAASGGNNYCEVVNNIVSGCTGHGIYIINGDDSMIRGNISSLNDLEGIEIEYTVRAQVQSNIVYQNVRPGILLDDAFQCTVEGNLCVENDRLVVGSFSGIYLDPGSMRNMVLGNVCVGNNQYGIRVVGPGNSVNSNVVAVNTRTGIYVEGSDCKVNDNMVYHNGVGVSNTYDGIGLAATADRCTVNGNTCYDDGTRQRHGIHLEDGAIDCTVNGNICYNNMTDGIRLTANNDYCSLIGNRCTGNGGWGINILAATCDKCIVLGCGLLGNVAGPLQDNGTLTEDAHNIVA